MFGYVSICFDMFGYVRKCLASLVMFGLVWIVLNRFWEVRICLDMFGWVLLG